jgi:hypothetical protein
LLACANHIRQLLLADAPRLPEFPQILYHAYHPMII